MPKVWLLVVVGLISCVPANVEVDVSASAADHAQSQQVQSQQVQAERAGLGFAHARVARTSEVLGANPRLPSVAQATRPLPTDIATQNFDLLRWESPIRDQGYRGTCTVFAAIGIAENIYRKLALIEDPDFSEEYLYPFIWVADWAGNDVALPFDPTGNWSQYRVRHWISNADAEYTAFSRIGTVAESSVPYAPIDFSGDGSWASRPLEPHYFLGDAHIVSSDASTMTHYLATAPVALGCIVQSQAWSAFDTLPVNQDHFQQGVITYPNATDRYNSRQMAEAHAISAVGWDFAHEEHKIDANGALTEEIERGFYLIRNSYGTQTGATIRNATTGQSTHLPGYQWLSRQIVENYCVAIAVDQPTDAQLACTCQRSPNLLAEGLCQRLYGVHPISGCTVTSRFGG